MAKGETSTGPIDPSVLMDLKRQLKRNCDAIQVKYAAFVSRLCECVKGKGVDVKDLRTFLLRLPAFKSDDLSDVKSTLEKADDMNRIFDALGNECASFVQYYGIFQRIKEKFCNDEDNEELNISRNSLKHSIFLIFLLLILI